MIIKGEAANQNEEEKKYSSFKSNVPMAENMIVKISIHIYSGKKKRKKE